MKFEHKNIDNSSPTTSNRCLHKSVLLNILNLQNQSTNYGYSLGLCIKYICIRHLLNGFILYSKHSEW